MAVTHILDVRLIDVIKAHLYGNRANDICMKVLKGYKLHG